MAFGLRSGDRYQANVLAAAAALSGVAIAVVALLTSRSFARLGKDDPLAESEDSKAKQKHEEEDEEEAEEEEAGFDVEDLAAKTEHGDREVWGRGFVQRSTRRALAQEKRIDEEPDRAAAVDHSSSSASSPSLPGRQRLYVKTYGCAHNNSDSEFMMGLLRDYGYTFADDLEGADACVVNSCTVKNPSQDTAMTLTKRATEAGKPVVLAGCVPSADHSVADGLEGVSLLSVTQLDRVVEVVEEALRGHVVRLLGNRRAMPSLDLPKVRKNRCVEIIPISGGCLGNCSYCKTKHARGRLMSYDPDTIVERALRAAAEGVSEVWLTSEDTGAYGIDLSTNIAVLLRRVADALLPAGVMLKLGMTNPPYMLAHLDEVAEVMKRPNVFEFIHIPVQSGSDKVLQSMIREYTVDDFRRLADGLRAAVPNILIATDIICGFPAEADEDHQNSLDLVKEYRFPVLNISQFYPRPGTKAAGMKKLQGHVVKARSSEMSRLFASYTTYDGLVGSEERVWFSETDDRYGQTVGHTKAYAKVVVPRDDALLGRSARVRLISASKWHVEGELLPDSES